MRHLFLPACICVMALSGGACAEPTSSVERLPDAISDDTSVTRSPETTGSIRDETNVQVAPKVADAPIEIPAQGTAEEAPPQPQRPASAKRVVRRSDQAICDTVTEAARSNDLPIPFFVRLLFQESGFKPNVVSRAGAQGIAQFMPQTAASVGLDNPFDPIKAIAASARLLRNLAQQFGNLGLAAAAYNAGPTRIQNWITKKGKLPDETKHYVRKITGQPAEKWIDRAAGTLAHELPQLAPCQQGDSALVATNEMYTRPLPSARGTRSSRTMTAAVARRSTGRAIHRVASKNAKGGAVQLAAARKKSSRKVRLSQR